MSKDKQVIIIDSSGIDLFLTCPVQWYYVHVLKIEKYQNEFNTSGELVDAAEEMKDGNTREMGTLGHAILDYKYRNKCTAMRAFNEVSVPANFLTKADIEQVRLTLFHYEAYYSAVGDFRVANPDSVELGFSELIYEDDDFQFILEGRIDILNASSKEGVEFVVDHKFQKTARPLYRKSIQFRNYAMVAFNKLKIRNFMVNYVRFGKTVTARSFERQLISFTQPDHEAWHYELVMIFRRMADFMEWVNLSKFSTEEFVIGEALRQNKNRASCQGKFGNECQFINLCDAPNELIRIGNLRQNYVNRKEIWRPW